MSCRGRERGKGRGRGPCDRSPPRRGGRRDHSESPPRRGCRRDHSKSPPRRGGDRDQSKSPPRRGGDRDQSKSPPRRRGHRDHSKSPPRRGGHRDQSKSPPRRRGHRDHSKSPPRRGGDRDQSKSPPRRGGDRDQSKSPPRRRGHRDHSKSPPRRGGDRDQSKSPPRRGGCRDKSPPERFTFPGEWPGLPGFGELNIGMGGSFQTSVTIPSEVSNPVMQPPIPYVGTIDGGIRPGMRLHVEGIVPHCAKEFQINFKTGQKDADDVAFHFNPRIGLYVYMNIFRNGKWQKEELGPDLPFKAGAPFKLLFLIHKDFYEVHVNGVFFYKFSHRIPLENVTTLAMSGDVLIMWFGFEKWTQPSFKESRLILMGIGRSTFIPLDVSVLITNPALPYVAAIPGWLKQDRAFIFQVIAPEDNKRFAINFKTGSSDGDDIAFHYNPRIGSVTALNCFRSGTWETEELAPIEPFTPGGAFIIIVVINSQGYEVYVNGFKHCTFRHRIPLEKVSALHVRGKASLLLCGFIDSWSTTSSYKELKKITSTQTSTSSLTCLPFDILNPISMPQLPYVGKIPGGLKQDMAVFLQGTVHGDAKSFAINFKTGPSDGDDIAFHYSPRIGSITALNTFRNGKWETEEKAPDEPFTTGGDFQIFIAINSNGYEVYVNGLKHCTFKHRIPLEKVSALSVNGDISLLLCGFIQKWTCPSLFVKEKKFILMGSGSSTFIPLEVSDPVSNPALPYVAAIPGWLKQDRAFVFQGIAPEANNSFAINFKTGPSDGDDIAFHYNPRIGSFTALNSFRSGTWEAEERAPVKPFTPGGAFTILVIINSQGYEVYVNGFKHCTFRHRIPLEKVSTLHVGGKASLLLCGFIDSWSTTSSYKELKKITSTQTSTSSLTCLPFDILNPISMPQLPYVGKIPGGLKQDMAVFLQGTVHGDAKSFAINFKTGPSDGDDIAFHYSPRIGDITALNTFRNGKWETEEKAPDEPFTTGGAFQIFIAINSNGYEVYVNGLKHCTFKHRIPLEKVSALSVNGDISLLLCGFIRKWTCPSLFVKEKKFILMGSGSSTFIPLEVSNPVSNPALPYVAAIPGWLKQDRAFVFQGIAPEDNNSFAINFKTGPSDGDDIAFHYNPRIGSFTALNSFRSGTWEAEERAPVKPFTPGGAFTILVIINSQGYEVYVNGFKHCTFRHRIPLEKVSTLHVGGKVSLILCGFIANWSTTSAYKKVKKITSTQTTTSSLTCLPFDISHPISMPELPYVGKIPGGLKQDMAVFLQGTVHGDAKSFAINFKTGPSDDDDIAFHYSPRIGDITALNTFRNGKWETEEKAPDEPFTTGGDFQIFIAINSNGYEVYVNGLKHCTYKHRIPLDNVSALSVNGDFSLLLCGFIRKWTCPSLFVKEKKFILMGSGSSTFIPLEVSNPVSNPALPYVAAIPGWLKQDRAFVFQGIAPEDNNSFAINFKTGPSDGDDVAFHYNPRIGSVTALNSFRSGTWEAEERAPVKPFTPGGAFTILVIINSQGYEVYVNGFKHCTFRHRIPLEKVSTLHVGGKVSLLLCGFIANWSTTSAYKKVKKITSTQTTTSSLTCLPFDISHPISMPELPYVGKIPGGLKQDMAVFLQGTVHGDAKSFAINFKTGPSDDDDIAFHYSPRIGDITALNTFRNGKWETEEKAPDEPFTTGGDFQIFIAINSNGYEVYVNGLKHCTYKHRIPLDNVSALSVNGDFSLLLCGFIRKWTCPSLFVKEKKFILMGSGSSTFIPLEVSNPVSNPALPYVAAIPGWLKQDRAFVFQGIAPEDNNSFAINFKTGPSDGDDVAFHYNPRIGSVTALNSFRSGTWEAEERAPVKPFTPGGAFTILVIINSQGYEVYVNGFKHCTFRHRIPLEKVSTLHVGGKVSLILCGFIANWSTTSAYKKVKKITSTQTTTSSLTCLPFDISHPISMPELPYVGKIPGGLKQDMAVFLQGTVHGDAKSFAINFKTGPSDDDDIAFHYSPRIGDITALNTFRNGKWETEEKAPDEPFTTGGDFQIFIAINSNGYEVYVNGLNHCTYKHRIPLDNVSALSVNGDFSLLLCGFIQKWTCPSLFVKEKKFILMGSGSSTFIPLEVSNPVSNPALPYVAAIPGWLKQDRAFVFQGIAPEDNNSFAINFKTGPSDGDDVAFHYNPRIGSFTALNSFRSGTWEAEERAPVKPFTPGGAFTILVIINSQGYEVYVNGFKHCTFRHRIPLEKVSTLHVGGKVSLLLCGFIANWSTTSSYKKVKKITSTQTTTSSLTCLPFDISHPISMPELPYVGKIPGGLKQDMAVFLQGTVHGDAKSFAINFKTGPSDDDDIAFHYSPRIGDITALNTFRNGKWETEEKAPDEPFTTGGDFQIFIAINSNGYEVYVNGLKHCTYKHRIPLDNVSALSVNGDFSLLLCGFIRKWTCPSLFVKEKKFILMGSGSSTFIPLEVSDPVSNPALPYVAAIPGWLKQDRAFVFQGIAPEDNNSFAINFKTGPSDGDDIAFHYNPRIGSVTALNSFRSGTWEAEERAPVKPFTPGGAFTILVIINSQGYEVYVNGFKHCTFRHRIPLEKVSTLHVGGKVSLILCGFIANWSTTSAYKKVKKITSTQTTTSSLTCLPFDISHPISMPELPYVGKIPGGLKQDMAVFLQGTVHGDAKSFAINFKTGPSDDDDIAFHYSPRIGDITALNTFRNGKWETEEKAPDEPFTTGGDFQIFIAINSNGYEVYVNGLKHCTYKHRIPLDNVSALSVNGDFSLLLCGFIRKWTCPSLFVKEKKFILMGSGSSTFIPLEVSNPVSNPALPYVAAIPGWLKQDRAFVFQGIAPEDNNSFAINFKTGPSDGDDVAFHYNPRIGSFTALNSFRSGTWEAEERAPVKPFTPGGAFTILVIINSQGYEVYVNGFKHCTFRHRIPLEKVSTLHVGGKVSLLLCGFIANWSTTSAYKKVKKITSTQTTTSSLTCLPFDISHPISMPELPYVGKIPGGLKQDMAVFLQGTVHGDAKSFAINFKTGPSDDDDIAFHYSPRIGDITALNTFRNGKWETEEKAPDEPFTTGGDFQIFIAINSNGYEVYVNGLNHCTYKHRIPLDNVSALSVNGDFSLLLCGFIQKWTCPSLFVKEKKFILMGSGSSTFIPLEVSNPVSNPALPYVAAIPGWLKQDRAFVFQGIAPEDNNSFAINFKTGPSDGDDVAFHYNPRIGSVTALNSFRSGTWEAEERAPVKPFTPGGAFTILVIINSQGYEVYVNGFKHCTFRHRIPLEKVSALHVGGKVSLLLCGFIANWSTTSSYKKVKKITSTQTTTSSLTCLPFDISHPISMPELPYVGKIPGGLKQDMAVFLQGTVHGDAKSFAINFKTGPSDDDDIAFHYSPRIGDITALNTFRNGKWETEEKAPDEPFTTGGDFQIFIAINSNGYEVYVNGLKHCTYKHRIPLDNVSALSVNGDFSLLLCGFIRKWTCPSLFVKEKKFILMGSGSSTFIPLEVSNPVSNPALPYVAAIPGWLKQDRAFVFQGIAPEDNNSFAINFKTGPSDGDDVAFHYNPRIGSFTALNSFRSGTWEAEERAPVKPFTPGGAFTILVIINSQGYEVYVNGFKHCTFRHRIPLEKVSTLHVGGKVSLILCGFIANWSTTSAYKKVKKITSTQTTTSSLTCLPFDISHPISMPELPYVGKIPGGLKQDMAVFLQGTVHGDAKSFAINFKTGPSDDDDIAFHYSPRIGDITALNTFRNGKWETEEKAPDEPFTTGGDFQIFIAINSNGYEVYVNGLNHCTYKHRIPLDNVSALSVNGDFSLLLCGFIRKWTCPSLFVKEKKFILMGSGSSTFIPLEVSNPVSNPALPYVAAIPGWLKQDRAFVFQGIAPEDNNSFAINFKTGPSDGDDVAFHYNPRIGSVTALNSFRSGTWEAEERAPVKPFTPGGAFTILVIINSQGYEVYVNGFKHCTFRHRIPLEKVSTLHVGGKVSLLLCGFIANWSTTSSYKKVKKITSTQTTTSSLTCLPFDISHPISMPELPYVGKIPGGLKQDMAVFLQGTVHGDAKSFAINFKTGPSDDDDIAFHYSPRIGDITALNTFRNGKWETEEKAPDEPFTTGGDFQIFIAVNSNGYEVYVNGLKHCTYKHRIPLDNVSALSVNGDFSLLLCGFIRKWTCPSLFVKEKKFILMGSGSSTFIPLEVSNPVSNPALPYVAAIPGWLKQDRAFVFQGIAPEDNNSFAINFKTGPSDGDDIAFHYNPRIGSVTALNSFRSGTWEAEERAPVKPFTPGGAFTILVIINSQGYEVYVNGFKHCTFRHRIPLEKVSTLHVGGKVSLILCGFIANWSTTSAYKKVKKITSTQTTTSSLTCLPFDISHPISMPELPYVGKIPGGLKQDMAVFLQGTVHGDAKSFAINFKTGPSDDDDIAFHYSPRIGDITALNTFRNGKWETEEKAPDEPFTTGGDFQIFIAINSNGYEVYVNGLNHCTYKHRIPLDNVSALSVNGDFSLLLCGFIRKWTCPSLFVKEKKFILMGSGSSTFIPLEVSNPVSNPALPYVAAIPGWLKQDRAFVFQGIAPEDNNSFAINFKTGPSDGDDVAFHYNPRIGSVTALNSFRSGTWEAEERAPVKPFTPGGAFTILVIINSQGYEVYVNGFKHCTFRHRIPLEKVSTLHVGGKVSLLLCGFIANWSTTSSYKKVKKITSTQTTTSSLTCLPFDISHPISMPELPYVGKIPGGLKQDMAVFLQGTVHGDAKSFAINFKTGPSDDDDIAFHYSPRIGDITALNTFRNGKWETEEKAPDEPFTTGGDFQIFIAINSNGYEVYVNGLKHCTYKHRIPLDNVSALSVNGDFSLLLCGFIRKWTCPSLFVKEKKFILMGSGSSTFIPLEVSNPVSNPALPYVAAIPGWLKQDRAFVFQGIAPEDNNSFAINFKTGPSDGDDIAFHYNPRIGSVTALNSFRSGTWEAEERAPVKPFTPGGAFTILVIINSQGYEVYVNGFKHCTFRHRIPLEKVSTLHVGGKVSLILCGFIANWSTTSSYKKVKKITSTQTTTSSLTCLPFDISHPISMPELPYVGKIPGGLKQDMAVFLQGTVHGDAKSFAINFKTGPSDDDDIAFHYSPRIGDITALNTFRNGKWETEEKAPDEPFTTGGDFQIFIAINSNGYEVYVNGLKHCTYKHRIPLDNVSALSVNGDFSLLLCGFIRKWTCPSLFVKEKKFILMGSGSSTFIPLEVSDPVSNPALPYVAAIPGWLKQDRAFVFQGIAPEDNNSFAINFKTGPSDGDDVAFHYNPRIGSVTALNSFRSGTWEAEERAPVKPFTPGGAFTILVIINSQGYEVYVNGFKHCTFRHRIPLEKVSTLHVGGKVSLILCGFIANWSTTSAYKKVKKITSTQTTTSSLTCLPFDISHPISMPELPYVGKIPGGLKQDMAVFLQGTVHGDAKSFAINFKTGPSDDDDIAFHYSPRIGDITALNTFRNGKWETEEKAPDEPFTTGGDFQIFIAINSNGYEVYVNGLKHCTYKHRIPLDNVSALSVNGDFSLLLCGFIRKWTCPSLFVKEKKFILMGSGSSTFIPLEVSNPVSNPALPYVAAIPGWLKQDRAFVFQGIAPEDNNSFAINFKTGPSDGDDVAFHYNPRIGSFTALNSFRSGTWEAEERAPVKPFTPGGAFTILVIINSQGYEVYVNGFKHCTFQHRIPLEKVSTLHVGGKVSLLLCGFIANWSTTSAYKKVKKITSTQTTTSSLTCLPFDISHPISMPELPYVGKIPGGLKQDMAVFLQGTVHGDAKSFAVNFKTGPSDDDDIAFHYSPRIGDITALNTFRNGKWETEEKAPDEPFTTGGDFQIFIAINSNGYEVYVNGLKHCTYKHRIPLDNVSALSVNGDFSLLLCGFIRKWTCPSLFVKEKKFILMGSGSSTFIPLEVSNPVSNPALPYVAAIPGWLKQDRAFVFQGIAPEDNNSFAINFKTGPSDGDDVAFHYNPRIGSFTALNSFRSGTWEAEERAPVKPFTPGGAFTILVIINSQGYEVYVNGFKHCTFQHRIPLEKVSTLHVGGKVSLLLCGFIANWSTTSSYTELKKITSTQTTTSSLTCLPFDISHPISMPELPYVGKIPGGLKQDMAVFLQGTVHGDAKSFAINFKTGPSDDDDIAFHYSPRIGDITALNTFRNGKWETEEKAPDEPFTTGGDFQIFIAINSNGYEVYVNGLKHCTYKHRIPLDNVSALSVNGDFSLLLCGFIRIQNASSFFMELQKMATPESVSIGEVIPPPVGSQVIGYLSEIRGGIKEDMAVLFKGSIPPDAKRFEINFKTRPADGDDIAFHYQPLIGNYTALNCFRNGSWETEETAPDPPFTVGKEFQIIVVINSEDYEVYVNNVKHCVFKHRIPPEKVSILAVHGDVSQFTSTFIQGWSTSAFFTELQNITVPGGICILPPIIQPALQYVGEISGGIKEDMAVLFKGSIPPDAKRFEINFKTGPADGDDIAFHYQPLIGNYTALNCFRNGSWETEETAPDPPFTVGKEFQITVVINSEDYEVYVNNVKHCVFKHRIPPEKVSTLAVHGDVSQFTSTFIQGWSTSSFFTELQNITMPGCICILPPIIQPALQYVGEISGGLKEDMAVLFKGSIPPDAKRFEINFKTGPADGDDIAFHYQPLIGNYTALNCFRNGSWETEETAPDPPFTVGKEFQITVVINSEDYEVYVNNVKHCVFKHRIPPEKVSTLAVHGDVSQFTSTFIQGWSTSSFFTELQNITMPGCICILPPIIQPALQYVGEISGGIKEDMAVLFKGSIPPDAKSFEINFKTGPADGDDIAFHYQPLIGNYTALNCFRNGSWETEETAPDPPFTVGKEFQITVVINSEDYEVYVNGVKHCVFKHRIPPEKVSTLAVHGDVSQFASTFIQGWSTSSFFTELQNITMPGGICILPPIIQPALQYVGEISGGIKEDMAVLFKGSIPPDAKSFEINFKTGPADGDDIAFHYQPLIGNYTALNCFRNGSWEPEETAPDPPFTVGKEFQITVVINSEDYEVYVNNVKHCVFKHRIPPEKVSILAVHGDVSQFTSTFIQGWSTSSFFTELQNITMPGGICILPPVIQPIKTCGRNLPVEGNPAKPVFVIVRIFSEQKRKIFDRCVKIQEGENFAQLYSKCHELVTLRCDNLDNNSVEGLQFFGGPGGI